MIGMIIALLLLALLLVVLAVVLDKMGLDGQMKQVVLLIVGVIGLLMIFFGGWAVPMPVVPVR